METIASPCHPAPIFWIWKDEHKDTHAGTSAQNRSWFTVASNQTVRVDLTIDMDHWRASSTRSFRPD